MSNSMTQSSRHDAERRYLRQDQLIGPKGIFPISKSTLWAWVKQGKFPSPLKLGARITVWDSRHIEAWLMSREPTKLEDVAEGEDA